MRNRIGLTAACVAALALCSCAPQAEVERARADAEAARAEAAALRTEVEAIKAREQAAEKAKEDAAAAQAKAVADAATAKARSAALEGEMRTRWNAVGPNFAVGNFGTFQWPGPDAFPHPTYKGGSHEAYTTFARALVAFLEAGDNFEFMRKNGLFDAEIGFALKGKLRLGAFAEQLAKPGSLAAGDEDNRKKLEALVAKIKAPPKA